MVLTPADVHNIAFSRPRIGKRGYSEQEVDLFIDLVEQELIRHLEEEEGDLRSRNAELRNRDGGLQKREVALCQRKAFLHQHECELHQHEEQLRQQELQLSQRASQIAKQGTPLPQQVAQPRSAASPARPAGRRASRAAHRPSSSAGTPGSGRRARRRGGCSQPGDPVAPAGSAIEGGAETRGGQRGARLGDERTVAAVHGRHDMDRMAIRAVTDTLGTVAGTVHERTGRSVLDNGGPGAAYDRAELELLKEENADLKRSLGMLKSAAALLAAALEQT